MFLHYTTEDPMPDGGRVLRHYCVEKNENTVTPGEFSIHQVNRQIDPQGSYVSGDVHAVKFNLEAAKVIHEQLGILIQKEER